MTNVAVKYKKPNRLIWRKESFDAKFKLHVLVNIVPDNKICKITQHKDSVETVLLKHKIFNLNKKEKYQRNCQM